MRLFLDSAKIDECNGILRKLREAWVQAIANLKKGPAAGPADAATQPG